MAPMAMVSAPRALPARRIHFHRTPQRPSIRCQAEEASSSPPPPPKADVCPTCGVPKNEIAFGCDGSGRIIGGLGAVPGFKWWPIKAYRPCPKATAAGIQYVRKGQDVDTILTGGRGK